MKIADAPRHDGRLMSTVDGGYPVIYYTADNAELCAECATDFMANPDAWNPEQCTVTQFDVFYEGAPVTCEHCYKVIESAYGDPGAEPNEPDEDAITSGDYQHWYQYGKLVLTIGADDDHIAALRAYMERRQFWPDAWIISDHGNAARLTIDME